MTETAISLAPHLMAPKSMVKFLMMAKQMAVGMASGMSKQHGRIMAGLPNSGFLLQHLPFLKKK